MKRRLFSFLLDLKRFPLEGSFFLIDGILILIFSSHNPMWLVAIGLTVFFLSTLINFVSFIRGSGEKVENAFSIFTKTIFTLFFMVLVYIGGIDGKKLALSYGAYASLVGFIHWFNVINQSKISPHYVKRHLPDAVVNLLFAILAFLFSESSQPFQMGMVGIYWIVLGGVKIYGSYYIFLDSYGRILSKDWRFSLPLALSIYFPEGLLVFLNDFLVGKVSPLLNDEEVIGQWDKVKVKFYFPEYQKTALGALPVVDFGYQNNVFRYVALNDEQGLFGLLSKGRIEVLSEDIYLEREATDNAEGVYYEVLLPVSSAKKLKKQMDDLHNFAEDLNVETGSYIISHPNFSRYSLFQTSSVALIDYLLGSAVIKKGLVSPLTYKNYLSKSYDKSVSRVIKKEVF